MRVKITKEELENGWDQESLDKYRRQRNRQQANLIFRKKKPAQPTEQNHIYSPFKWRR